MKTNITLSAALLIAAIASAHGQAPAPAVQPVVEPLPAPSVPRAIPVPADSEALPAPAGLPGLPGGAPPAVESLPPHGSGGATPLPTTPRVAPPAPGFGPDVMIVPGQPGFAELVGPGPDNRPRITVHRGQQGFDAPVPVDQPGQPFVSRADQVVREAKFKVYQRHYETALTELMDIEKALLDAPAEKREALAARAKALRDFSDKLEADLRKLAETPPVAAGGGKPGRVHFGAGAMSATPARIADPSAPPAPPGSGAPPQRR